jgi:hypothetical protein
MPNKKQDHSIKTALSQVISSILWMAVCASMLTPNAAAQTGAWPMSSHDEQHSALSTVQSQPLETIHWHVPVDLSPPSGEITIHYGSPLVTAANTVIVPVKTGPNSFRVEAHNGANGKRLWAQKTGWQARQPSPPGSDLRFRTTRSSFLTLPVACWCGRIPTKLSAL